MHDENQNEINDYQTVRDFIASTKNNEINDRIDTILEKVTLPIDTFHKSINTLELSKNEFSESLINKYDINYNSTYIVESKYILIPILALSTNIRKADMIEDSEIIDFVKQTTDMIIILTDRVINEGCVVEASQTQTKDYYNYFLKIEISSETPSETIALESIDYKGNKSLKQAVESTLAIFKMLDETEYERIKELINSFTKEEDLIKFLIEPINVYFEPGKEPKGLVLNDIKKKERIIISEPMYLPFKGKVEVDGVSYPVRSAKKLTMYHTYVRKNQQIAAKESKSADTKSVSDILGMSAGGDKVGTFSDAELTACLQQNNFNIIKELCGPASADLGQKREMRNQLMNTGEVNLSDLPDSTDNKRVLHYLDHVLKSMGMDSDLVQFPE